ncbi:hypothetical protein [Psychrobacter sp. I-STPA10]|uniref:hypothetical protein n=1 Tax=Psychrobacter sp. I-STPA10 TaxID=2585769 RepID=UPI001E5B52E2|nr:hypothetical protein [Psychrobacter sp. I-STPA10]
MRSFNASSSFCKRDSKHSSKCRTNYLVATLLLSICTLSACQKQDNAETQAEDIQVTTITPPAEAASTATTDAQTDTAEKVAQQDETKQLLNEQAGEQTNDGAVEVISNDDIPTTAQADNQLIADDIAKEKQITDVEYRSESGGTLKVTFQTSATAELQANVLLPSGKRVLLTAPPAQGNNPTYRSQDGSIELVSHSGGGSIDLVQNGKITNFDATSAEAEVVVSQ